MMLYVDGLASLKAGGPVRREAGSQKLFQLVWINCVAVCPIIIETNKDNVHFKWNLKGNLCNAFISFCMCSKGLYI